VKGKRKKGEKARRNRESVVKGCRSIQEKLAKRELSSVILESNQAR
jgi:hypothetical protein